MPGEPDQAQAPQPTLTEPALLAAEPARPEPALRREEHELPDGRHLIAYWSGGNA